MAPKATFLVLLRVMEFSPVVVCMDNYAWDLPCSSTRSPCVNLKIIYKKKKKGGVVRWSIQTSFTLPVCKFGSEGESAWFRIFNYICPYHPTHGFFYEFSLSLSLVPQRYNKCTTTFYQCDPFFRISHMIKGSDCRPFCQLWWAHMVTWLLY